MRIFILAIFGILFSCQNTQNPSERIKPDLTKTDFIYLNGNHFELKKEKYFPLMLNYIVSFRNINNEFIVSPHIDYEKIDTFETNTKHDIEEQLRAHFQLIQEMGFNSIRLCFDRIGIDSNQYYYGADGKAYFINTDYDKILAGLETAIHMAHEKGLRVMLLMKAPIEKDLENFAIHVLEKFKDNPTIFAYDFMNEPLYFDKDPERKKTGACKIVTHWMELMNKYAPNQLFTIGFSEPIETFEWDPALLPVDFISFHTYHPLRVKNEIYWYSTYTGKPWMIGETSLPADNISISYQDQASFMKETYQYVVDCGGAGFGWWDFQEAKAGNFEAMYTGILNHNGTTTTKDGKYTIIGSVKLAAKEIQGFSKYIPKEKVRPVNYFNMIGYNNYVIKGKILNRKTKEPVEGAVIRGWTKTWIGMNTFTDEKGEFRLYSNDEVVHFEISAPKMEKIRFDREGIQYKQILLGNFDKNNLPDQHLEYHQISYKTFLKDAAKSVFDFDESKFNQAKFEAEMETLYLLPMK